MNKDYDYKKIHPFKWFVLQNFPFIEEDFDAITNYQLFCKLGEEINKVIASTNAMGTQVEELTDYVNYYFDNLDVQDEVNNKLDEMAESGELTEIIAQYLQLAGLLCFNTKADMKGAENLVNGSFAKTYGTTTYNDGYGEFYKIRTLLNTDVIDDDNIVALTNYPTLIAEKIPNAYISSLQTQINTTNSNINNINQKLADDIVVLLGDSYGIHNAHASHDWYSWADKLASMRGWVEGTNYFNFCTGNSGLTVTDNNYYSNLLANESRITDKTKVKTFIIAGGYNDNYYFSGSNNDSDYATALSQLVTYIKTNYPNAKIYMGMIGNSKALNGTGIRSVMINNALYGYSKIAEYENCYYMKNIECVMRRYDYFISDNTHPNDAGAKMLAYAINENVYGKGYEPIFNKAQITFSNATINIAQIGKNIELSMTGSIYPTIAISDDTEQPFTSSYTIAEDKPYLRSVSEPFSAIPFVANAVCSDNTQCMISGRIFIKSDDGSLIFKIKPTSVLIGKTIGRLDFKYSPVLLPIIYF